MKKRTLALSLAIAVLAAAISGCVPQATSNSSSEEQTSSSIEAAKENFNKTGLPIVNEPVDITLAAITRKNKNFDDLQYFQELEAKTNVNVNWNMSAKEGWAEKKSLLFAGNDLPDAFYGFENLTDVEIVKYAAQGMFIPLNDLIDEYAPNFKHVLDLNPAYRAQITAPDGNIYALPSITELSPTTHSKFFLNKTWLDKLGLPVPETLEDFEKTLQAFRDNDMNGNGSKDDEIPFTFRAKDIRQQNLAPLFGSFGQLDDFTHFVVEDGKVVYTAMTEPYREAIKYFNGLYSKGLLDKEGFTHDANVYVAKIQDPGKICGGFLGWSRNSTGGPNKDDYVAIAPLKSADGKQVWKPVDSQITSKGSFAITKKATNPEIIMRWIDESYEPEASLQIDQGLIGVTLEKTPEGRYKYLPMPEGKMLADQIHDFGPGTDGVSAVITEISDKLDLNENLIERAELDEFYAPYNVPLTDVFPNVLFTMEEVESLAVLKTDIEAYVEKNYAGWISGGTIDKDWDAYIAKLGEMKVEDYIKIHQQAYDRYTEALAAAK